MLVAGAIAAMACSDDDGGQGPGGGDPPAGDVQVRNNNFSPASVDVEAGETVVWAWASGGVTHNVTFDDGPTSGNQASGTYSREFTEPGDFPYHCTIHGQSMSGVVNVTAAAALRLPV
jgi:plastocyanin